MHAAPAAARPRGGTAAAFSATRLTATAPDPAPPAQAAPADADGRRAEDHEHDEGGEPRVVAVEEPVPEHPGEGTGDDGRGHHDGGDAAGRAVGRRPPGRP